MTIGERIKLLRTQNNLTQEELANYAKTTKQTIHKYETGIITNIPAIKIKAISEKLCTTPAYLMGWEGKQESSYSLPQPTITENIDKHINIIKIAGRDGSYEERALTDEQLELFKKMINALPEATDL